MKRLWIWEWTNGGYNSCQAPTREDALQQARVIGSPNLQVNESTLHEGTHKELERLDRAWASLFY